MDTVFNANEVFEIAEQIERNGATFYQRAAEHAEREDARKMLLQLATMEERHERIFAAIHERMQQQVNLPPVYDQDDGALHYVQAVAGGFVFDIKSDPSKALTGRETFEEVLRRAIGLEKDSVVFYQGMREIVPPDLGQARIEEIIRQEMAHITVLSRELAKTAR